MMSTVLVGRGGVDAVGPNEVECPECGSVLALHQPDERRADRLLATCGECKAWFLTTPKARRFVRLTETGRRAD
jgi:hypothetical protein